jgi:hypothetical protein
VILKEARQIEALVEFSANLYIESRKICIELTRNLSNFNSLWVLSNEYSGRTTINL